MIILAETLIASCVLATLEALRRFKKYKYIKETQLHEICKTDIQEAKLIY
jgi:hypothetical protein